MCGRLRESQANPLYYVVTNNRSRKNTRGRLVKQRPNLNPIDRVYRSTNNDFNLAGGASGVLSFTKADFGFTTDDAIRPYEFRITLGVANGVAGNAAPVQTRFSWVYEGVVNSRTMMVSPGTQKVYRLRVPTSTDYATAPATTTLVNVHMLNMTNSLATVGVVLVEAWFGKMPAFP